MAGTTANKAGRKSAPKDESATAKFDRVVGGRIDKALAALDSITAGAQSRIMEYDATKASKAGAALRAKVEQVIAALDSNVGPKANGKGAAKRARFSF